MRREKLVCILFFAVLAASIINVIYISRLSLSLNALISTAEAFAQNEQYDEALETINLAQADWNSKRKYTGVFLRHPDIDSINDCFFDVKAEIAKRENEALPALCDKLRHHISCIADMEKLRLESIL